MPIAPPRLDDRAYNDLVAELVARVPAHTPEWTNVAPGDPGRTLIELFAWLTDTILYRANLVPERQRLVFLRLLGIDIRAAIAARGMVALRFDDEDATSARVLRAGGSVNGPAEFELARETTVLPVTGEVYCKRRLNETELAQMSDIVEELRALHELPDKALPYVTTQAFPGESASPAGFDLLEESIDASLWVALLAPKPETVQAIRKDLTSGNQGRARLINVGVAPAYAPLEALDEIPTLTPVEHVWEVTTGKVIRGRPVMRALEVVNDESQGLTRRGVVELALPGGDLGAPENDVAAQIDAGVGLRPPRLDDPELAARLVTWLRLRPVEKLTSLKLSWLGVNAASVEQLKTVRNRIVGQSDGSADQRIQLPATSVDPQTLQVQVEGPEGYVPWQRVDDLSTLASDDMAYRLDAEAGQLIYGNGIRGRVPELGRRIRVVQMRSGGGTVGNLAPDSLKEVVAEDIQGVRVSGLKAKQALATYGGADAESLVDAEQRIPAVLKHRNRAVTEQDYRTLTYTTPGVRVARVELLPRFKPHQRLFDVPGVISVMALPAKIGSEAPNPRPDRVFIESVHAWLDERRCLGTELYVIGTEYVPLGASVAVKLRDGFPREETLTQVREAIRAYLWPLAPGGPLAQGWPLGAAVTNLELEVAVARVPGVASVNGLNVFGVDGEEWELLQKSSSGTQSLSLEAWQLPELLGVVVTTDDVEPDNLDGLPNPFGTSDGVAVPVVPEIC